MLRIQEILFETKYLKIAPFICEIRLFQFLIKIANILRLEKLDKIKSDLFCRQIQLLVHRSLNNSLLEVREVWLSPGKYELVISEEKNNNLPSHLHKQD